MKTFKNPNFVKRSYDRTHIICCVGLAAPKDGRTWVECDATEIKWLEQLYTVAGVTYYGFT